MMSGELVLAVGTAGSNPEPKAACRIHAGSQGTFVDQISALPEVLMSSNYKTRSVEVGAGRQLNWRI